MCPLDRMAPVSHSDFLRGVAHGAAIFQGSLPTDGASPGLFEKAIEFPEARSLPVSVANGRCSVWGSWDPVPKEPPLSQMLKLVLSRYRCLIFSRDRADGFQQVTFSAGG